jgi:hypothetical protein
MTVTGRDIIEELVERMRTESEPLRYSALAHGVYRVFLHREDYDRVSPARRALVEEASRALDEELDRINAHRTPAPDQWGKIVQAATRLVKPAEPPLRRPPSAGRLGHRALPRRRRGAAPRPHPHHVGARPAAGPGHPRRGSDAPRPAARRLGLRAGRAAETRAPGCGSARASAGGSGVSARGSAAG